MPPAIAQNFSACRAGSSSGCSLITLDARLGTGLSP
jgi:hypothetical protein